MAAPAGVSSCAETLPGRIEISKVITSRMMNRLFFFTEDHLLLSIYGLWMHIQGSYLPVAVLYSQEVGAAAFGYDFMLTLSGEVDK